MGIKYLYSHLHLTTHFTSITISLVFFLWYIKKIVENNYNDLNSTTAYSFKDKSAETKIFSCSIIIIHIFFFYFCVQHFNNATSVNMQMFCFGSSSITWSMKTTYFRNVLPKKCFCIDLTTALFSAVLPLMPLPIVFSCGRGVADLILM